MPLALSQEKLYTAFESNTVAAFIEAETNGYIAKIIATVPHLSIFSKDNFDKGRINAKVVGNYHK